MKVTVCQLHNGPAAFADEWNELVAHARAQDSELVLLPEMPFCKWFADSRHLDPDVWEAAVRSHDEWEERLRDLAPAVVLGTRPVDFGNERYDEGFVWDVENGSRAAHAKAYVPNEDGMWEASWYNRATPAFFPFELDHVSLGFLVGLELWSISEARMYGAEGVQVLVAPRTTNAVSFDQWLSAGRAAAVAAGAYCISSNRIDRSGAFGGRGWIIAPDGDVLGLTSAEHPFLSSDLDLAVADRAKIALSRNAPLTRFRPRVKFESTP